MEKITVYNLNPQTTEIRRKEYILSLVDRFLIMNNISLPKENIFAAYEQQAGGLMIRITTVSKVIATFIVNNSNTSNKSNNKKE